MVNDRPSVARVIGRACLSGPPDAIYAADPIEPARAIRRALADAGTKAFEVDYVAVGARQEPSHTTCVTLARRALGPRGQVTRTAGTAVDDDDPGRIAASVVQSLTDASAPAWTLAVAVGVGSDGTIVALCVRRGRL